MKYIVPTQKNTELDVKQKSNCHKIL